MGKKNHEMVEIVYLRGRLSKETKNKEEAIKWLGRVVRELETISSQHDDKGSEKLINQVKSFMESEDDKPRNT